MSKSNKKQPDRLKDSCRKERRRTERHYINQLLKEGRYEELDSIQELPLEEESGKRREN